MISKKPLLLSPLQQACGSHEVERVSNTSGWQPPCCNQLILLFEPKTPGLARQRPPGAERAALRGVDEPPAGGRGVPRVSPAAAPGPLLPGALDAEPQLCRALGRWHILDTLHF